MRTAQTHSFATPVVREVPPSWMEENALRLAQRERVLASLLVRP